MAHPDDDPESQRLRIEELERRLAEVERERDRLRAGEAHWRGVLGAVPEIVAVLEPAEGYPVRFVNRVPSALEGQTVEGSPALSLLTPTTAEDADRCLRRVRETGEVCGFLGHVLTPSANDARWYAAQAGPLFGDDGELDGLVVLAVDVTERQRADQQLRLVNEQLPAVIWSTDRELRFTSSSGLGLQAIGLEPGQVEGTSLEQLFGSDDNERVQAHVRALGGESVRFEAHWQGRVFDAWVEPLLDAEGRIMGTIGLALDVTDRRELEEQLRQAQKMDAVGQLAGGIAHDFNNLLTAILGQTEMARRRLHDEHALQHGLDEIRHAADRAAGLTRQLLAFSRRQVLQPSVLDPGEVVRGIEEMLRPLLGETIEVVTELEPAGHVRADRGQLEQVLVNLAVNARDAMPEGGRLTISTQEVSLEEGTLADLPAGRYATLSVHDTGAGIDQVVQERMFEPFFTTKQAGTGLGLSMVYGIVKQSGGHVEAHSTPGVGTTFRVLLPRSREATADVPASRREATTGEGAEAILLVEDEQLVRKLARQVLGDAGYEVIEAADGREALAVLARRDEPVDLVVTDVVMPTMDGQQLARRIADESPRTRFLFMSGYPHDLGPPPRDGRRPPSPLLPKPFTPQELKRAVRRVLDDVPSPTR